VVDGWNFTEEQLKQLLGAVGKPLWVIHLKADKTEQVAAFKRKKEMEAD